MLRHSSVLYSVKSRSWWCRVFVYHVEVVLCVCSSQQIPYEHVPIVAGRQDDPGIKRVRFEDKHLGFMALKTTLMSVISALNVWGSIYICSDCLKTVQNKNILNNYFKDM